jgi:hypothetical protein
MTDCKAVVSIAAMTDGSSSRAGCATAQWLPSPPPDDDPMTVQLPVVDDAVMVSTAR